ncbi:hypothetical protein [Spiroplasma phoeniceum]|uniref:hypothetical protein n=1 Tax=Spiroplasma phoeniceum TaxID=47835 RepID=UPI0012486C93|nr:hypothetical protein [Spiroplasma phoeniceum]
MKKIIILVEIILFVYILIKIMLISFFITIILPNKTITYDHTNTIEKNNKYSMKDLIKEPNLGKIPSNSINDIRNALYYKNPTLNQSFNKPLY